MLNSLIVATPFLGMTAVAILMSLKPRIKPLSPDELKETACYQNRINRKGVLNNPRYAVATSIEPAKEKPVYLLGPRQWA